ncbi:hypothetical protein [Niveispirillum sp.]|uniref:hypothetical protein n=1 Tax=Niveispirillum sp. TaxID=1917217 RepID=UPI001B453D4B|nr:hypothetical protein [Niveispirillum sp.]MBP7339097.1 hypothetical protein [Niveispirillum sp.]
MGILTMITPAPDLGLLSVAELRAAVGLAVDDDSRDADLTVLGLEVAGRIASFCGVAPAGNAPTTLREEVVEEVWRLGRPVASLVLSRRFVSAVESATVGGVSADTDLLELDGPAGLLSRLDSGDRYCRWPCGVKLTVRYRAGFSTVPDDLKAAGKDLLRLMDSGAGRDPLLRARQVDGVGRDEFQIASGMVMDGGLPKDIADRLSRFATVAI